MQQAKKSIFFSHFFAFFHIILQNMIFPLFSGCSFLNVSTVFSLTFLFSCVSLVRGDNMKQKDNGWYDEDLDYYFILCIHTPNGPRYAYNQRTFVTDIDFAKKFETRRSALRCARLGNFKSFELLKIPRTFE